MQTDQNYYAATMPLPKKVVAALFCVTPTELYRLIGLAGLSIGRRIKLTPVEISTLMDKWSLKITVEEAHRRMLPAQQALRLDSANRRYKRQSITTKTT